MENYDITQKKKKKKLIAVQSACDEVDRKYKNLSKN